MLRKGVYDQLITASLRAQLDNLPPTLKAHILDLSSEDAVEYLARHIAKQIRPYLRLLAEQSQGSELAWANGLLRYAKVQDNMETSVLQAVADSVATNMLEPAIPLSQSALITNNHGLNYQALLRSELGCADRVDFICPFIGNQGINLIWGELAAFGERLRIITTTYLGATNQRALERLAETGAQVKIAYERNDQKTALHAKAWIFHRESGFTTAAIGSSNLSPKALVDGLEWNVRISYQDAPQVLDELAVTFERLWNDNLVELFDPTRDRERLQMALKTQGGATSSQAFFVDVQPLQHQQEALDELAYARLEGMNENLIVAATGTGKTLLSAFDFKRFATTQKGRPSLLFVAHRGDILQQSISAFRQVLRDQDFGELQVGEFRANAWRHVFASVQSLSHSRLDEIHPEHFEFIVIDEFHHAAAPTYQRLLDHFQPKQLLGLTATPERTDGRSVIDRFGSPTYELRLWHALDRRLLCPFHYFGVDDKTDLSHLPWVGGRYADAALDQEYVARGTERAKLVIQHLLEKVDDLSGLRAVAFCATIRHATFMAEQFVAHGLTAKPLHSGLPIEEREETVRSFRRGDLPIICTVDLFNEGVDIPEINTVLFLRPTESATVFIQQLGRGLRNHEDKGALTVLDFVGVQNHKFRMDLRFRAMTGLSRSALSRAVEADFPTLPPGCAIRLDRHTQESVLRNIRSAIPSSKRAIIEELRRMHSAGVPLSLSNVLQETGLEAKDFYKNRSLNTLLAAAGLVLKEVPETTRLAAFIHVDDHRRIEAYRGALQDLSEGSFARMIAYTLGGSMNLGKTHEVVRQELIELLDVLAASAHHRPIVENDLPFSLHCHYTRDEFVAPFRDNPASMREGWFYVKDKQLDVHLMTLRKTERLFSPTTRYADYFIAPDQLHWESQSGTTATSPTGRRLMAGEGRHLFFARENKEDPFLCLGLGHVVSSRGEKPIKMVWKLDHAVPDHHYVRFLASSG